MQDYINKSFFALLVFTLIFGVMFYDIIDVMGFSYIDEICAVLIFGLFGYHTLQSRTWAFNRGFLYVIGVFVFYFIYSLAIGSNSVQGIAMDFLIQIKPYIAFFCVYSLRTELTRNQKSILRNLAFLFTLYLIPIGLSEAVYGGHIIRAFLGHESRFATSATILAVIYLYCSDFTPRDKFIYVCLLAVGLFSGRSKLFGFLALSTLMLIYMNRSFRMRLDLRNTFFLLLALAATAYVAKDKIELYFVTGGFGGGRSEEDLYARMALYYFSIPIFLQYIPFGSGFASYGTYASGVYYSKLYNRFGMDHMYGLTESSPKFVADTYYPALAQFGFVGVALFFFFWIHLASKAVKAYRIGLKKEAVIALLIIIFFAIESTSDATITHNRGLFMMMMLGLLMSDIRSGMQAATPPQRPLPLKQHPNE